jgi:hypothetical protein
MPAEIGNSLLESIPDPIAIRERLEVIEFEKRVLRAVLREMERPDPPSTRSRAGDGRVLPEAAHAS